MKPVVLNAKEFATEFAAELFAEIEREVNTFASDLFAWIVLSTPRDTGRAQESWDIEPGQAYDTDVPPEGHYQEWSRQFLAAYALAKIQLGDFGTLDRTILTDLWYMASLVQGTSSKGYPLKEAPPDWYWRAIREEITNLEARGAEAAGMGGFRLSFNVEAAT